MITRSGAFVAKKQLQNQIRNAAIVQAPQRKFAGGGPKKPAMSATETDFDIVFVGKNIVMS